MKEKDDTVGTLGNCGSFYCGTGLALTTYNTVISNYSNKVLMLSNRPILITTFLSSLSVRIETAKRSFLRVTNRKMVKWNSNGRWKHASGIDLFRGATRIPTEEMSQSNHWSGSLSDGLCEI